MWTDAPPNRQKEVVCAFRLLLESTVRIVEITPHLCTTVHVFYLCTRMLSFNGVPLAGHRHSLWTPTLSL